MRTCKYCGQKGLEWRKQEGGKWALLEDGERPHKCPGKAERRPKPPSQTEAVVLLGKILAAVEENNRLLQAALSRS